MTDPIRLEAEARHQLHILHPTHRPLSDGYELVGLRGEEALAREFGLSVDLVARPEGDGGLDNSLRLWVLRRFPVDVKCARKPGHLIVEEGKAKPNTIYVLARYSDETDSAELIGWEWGQTLMGAPIRDFGYGVRNHSIRAADLRPISELHDRMVAG
jgi:hypothetical protein